MNKTLRNTGIGLIAFSAGTYLLCNEYNKIETIENQIKPIEITKIDINYKHNRGYDFETLSNYYK